MTRCRTGRLPLDTEEDVQEFIAELRKVAEIQRGPGDPPAPEVEYRPFLCLFCNRTHVMVRRNR